MHSPHTIPFTPFHIPAVSGSCLLQQLPQISDQICQFPLRPISRLTEVLSGNLTDLFQMVGDGIPVEEAFCCHFLDIAIFLKVSFQNLQVLASRLLIDPLQFAERL